MNTKNELTTTNALTVFKLPALISIDTVKNLFETLKPAVETFEGETFILDATDAETITTPGIQLLLALEQAMESRNKHLGITNIPVSMREAFELNGCQIQLERMKHTA